MASTTTFSASWLSASVPRVSTCSFSSVTIATAARAILEAAASLPLSKSGVPSRASSLPAAPESSRRSPSNAVAFARETLTSAVA